MPSYARLMLVWGEPETEEQTGCPGVRRAYDDFALYVIHTEPAGFTVGYYPSPGPECEWRTGLRTLEEAMQAAEACAAHVRAIRAQDLE
jgi:hypothetical protein